MSRYLESGAARNLENSTPRAVETGEVPALLITASGSGQSDGSVALIFVLDVRASGLGQADGSVALTSFLPVVASGSGQFDGSVSLLGTPELAASGSGLFGGSVALTSILPLTASGLGQFDGSANPFAPTRYSITAQGVGLFTGSAVFYTDVIVDIDVTVGDLRSDDSFVVAEMRADPPFGVEAFSAPIFVSDFTDATVDVHELRAETAVTVAAVA